MSLALLAALAEGAVVVTPNRRLARILQRDFDLAQRASGKTAWPTPSILPYPLWLESLWAEAVAADAVGEPALLLSTTQSALQWQSVVDADADRVPLLHPRGAAALASEAWSLVHQWGAGGESWRAWRTDAATADDPAVFARWAEAYGARLRGLRAVDPARLPDALTALAGRLAAISRPTVFAGFLELTPQQERLLGALRASGTDVRRLDTLPDRGASAGRTLAATPRDEIAAALTWAREQALARPEARIGVVVEDLGARRSEVVALAEDLLCPGAILPGDGSPAPFDLSLGIPLPEVPLVGAALSLIALAESRLPVAAAATLLRSPYLTGAESTWAHRAGIERDWLEEGRREVTLTDAIAASERRAPDLAERWRGGRAALRGTGRSSPREWADAWRAWLAAAGWPGSRALDSDEYQAREAWERLLAEFTSLGAVAPRLARSAALSTLQALAAETLFQPEGGAAIQILGVLEGTGLAFDALWVAGLTADRWPAAPSPNPLLPLAWQRERNLPRGSARREREYAEALTARFARAAPEVVFSSAANVDDHALSPSALILAYPERPAATRPPIWAHEIARGAALEKIADDRAPPLPPGSRAPGGVRIVAAQSDCPFQAAARHRLGAEPWPSPVAGLSPQERGRLAHLALAAFWTAVRDHAALVALDGPQLASRVAAAVEAALADLPASRWRVLPSLLRAGEERRLTTLLQDWLEVERPRPPFTVLEIESPGSLRLAGIEFRLRRDRIDALADGGTAILDYKTGQIERPRQWFDERPRAPQLGLYTLAQRDANPQAAVRAVAYVALRPEGVETGGLVADDRAWPGLEAVATAAPGGTWSSLEDWWRTHLEALAAEIAAGHAAVMPRTAPSPCRNCRLHALCRIESVRGFYTGEAADE